MGEMLRFRRKLGPPDFVRMNLPEDYWTAKVQGVSEKVRPAVVRYLRQIDRLVPDGVGLFVHGEPGVGKTGIAALVCKETRAAGYTVYFTSVWELRELIRARVAFDDDTSMLRRCQDVDVLVLDGLQTEDANDRVFGKREIAELIAHRARARKVTVVTTQLGAAELRGSMKPVLDAAQGSMVHLTVEGPNLRRARQDELRKVVFGD